MHSAPTVEQFGQPTSNSIPTIIRSFKATVTKQINELRNTPGLPVWQRNYFDRIVRNDDELNRIREYILYNPLKWQLDSPREIEEEIQNLLLMKPRPDIISRGKENPENL